MANEKYAMLGLLPTENWEYGLGDFLRGLMTALGSSRTCDKLNIPGIGSCIPTRSARSGLIAALKAINLPSGARIGVPLYCCPVVFKAIKASGYQVSFLDVDYSTYCISIEDFSTKQSQLDAVIAVHMFGNMCDIPSLKEVAHGIPIIEDCAQSIGSKMNGQMAGSFGTISVFSFRSGKYLSVGEGGAVFSNQSEILSRLSRITSEMPLANRLEELSHVIKTYIRSLLRRNPFYGVVGYTLWKIYNEKVSYSAKTPIAMSQSYQTDLATVKDRLLMLDSAIKIQRWNADYYSRTLKLEPAMLCSEKPGTFYNRYLYPILFHTPEQRDAMASYLFSHQIDTAKPYGDIAEVAAIHYGYSGDCPRAEQIARKVLVIPSHNRLNKKDVQRISQYLNEGWVEIIARS